MHDLYVYNPFRFAPNEGEHSSCTDGVDLLVIDRVIFWVGGFMVFLVTAFLLVGAIISKKLREQPGDLIIGIAFADFLSSIYWILIASFADHVNNPNFCIPMGALAVFATGCEFLYNVAFSLYLIMSLRNALRQSKIPSQAFHITAFVISIGYIVVLSIFDGLGKTMVGTCAIKAICDSTVYTHIGTIVIASYAFIGLFTFLYVAKNAPKCQRAYAKRTALLLYYLKYIGVCIGISVLTFVTSLFTAIEVQMGEHQTAYSWVNSLYNFLNVCSPLILSIIRLNDPSIKSTVRNTMFFWRKDKIPQEGNSSLLPGIQNTQDEDGSPTTKMFESGQIHFSLPLHRKVEITFTLLSCIQFNSAWKSSYSDVQVWDEKSNNRFKRQRVFLIDEQTITSVLPSVKEELERTKYGILSGTFKVYAPELFKDFVENDSLFLNILESLNFQKNREQIRAASKADGGKSGEFFFFSSDKKLILKTIPDSEMELLVKILDRYEKHFNTYPNSLIAKIYGAFTFENSSLGLKFNIILFKNICGFPSRFVLRTYDLKGSTYDRQVIKNEVIGRNYSLNDQVLKDIDFENYEKKLKIKPELREEFLNQIKQDSLFFRNAHIIDYSFLVFVVNKKEAYKEETNKENDFTAKNHLASIENIEEDGVFYNMGIIDYLQPYNFQKRTERFFKRLKKLDPNLDTSSQNPQYYSSRFIQFISQHIPQDRKTSESYMDKSVY